MLSAKDPSLSPLVAEGEEPAVATMLGERASKGWFGFALRHTWARELLMLAERFLLGGIFTHYLARKRWIEREVKRALSGGIRQVVVLGAGYDTLAWRLHGRFPGVRFFEIDHPATQASKLEALGEWKNLRFLPGDLSREAIPEILAAHDEYDAAKPSIVIAEGLTMYFSGLKVREILRSSAEIAGGEGRVIFSFMEEREDGSIHFQGENPAVGWWLRSRREPFRWGCRREVLPDFLGEVGLSVDRVANHRDLRSGVLSALNVPRLPLARGESLCLCTPSRP